MPLAAVGRPVVAAEWGEATGTVAEAWVGVAWVAVIAAEAGMAAEATRRAATATATATAT